MSGNEQKTVKFRSSLTSQRFVTPAGKESSQSTIPTAHIVEETTTKRTPKTTSKIEQHKDTFIEAISTSSSPTTRPVNYHMNRTSCDIRLSKTLMCPPLYTEIGGKCNYNNTKVVCNDVRSLSEYRVRQSQLVIAQLLHAFDVVARKHDIKYWLTSGTLLGAVRHKGFIPWDDDGDIEMTLDEYEKFYRNASKDLPDNMFFQNSESDPYLRPSSRKEYKSLKYKDIGLYRRTWNPRLRDRNSCYRYCIDYGCKWHDGAMVDMFIVEDIPEGSYPLKEALFEGLRFPVQNNWDEVLSSKYGKKYMKIPKKISFAAYYPDPEHGCEELNK